MIKTNKTIVLDPGYGNVGSIINMLKKLDLEPEINNSKSVVRNARRIILPGVGHFDKGMNSIKERGIPELIYEAVGKYQIPLLGICLGMQMLFDSSEEGSMEGLGLIPGKVKKFRQKDFGRNSTLSIPHMSWNTVTTSSKDILLRDFDDEPRFYFVHSYHAIPHNEENTIGMTSYGHQFSSIVKNDNIYGVQFHPEKSLRFGMKLLQNYALVK